MKLLYLLYLLMLSLPLFAHFGARRPAPDTRYFASLTDFT